MNDEGALFDLGEVARLGDDRESERGLLELGVGAGELQNGFLDDVGRVEAGVIDVEEVRGEKFEGLDASQNGVELVGVGVRSVVDGEELSSPDEDVAGIGLDLRGSESEEGEIKGSGVLDTLGDVNESGDEELLLSDEDDLGEGAVRGEGDCVGFRPVDQEGGE